MYHVYVFQPVGLIPSLHTCHSQDINHKQGFRDKRGVTEQDICTDSILKMCFSNMKPILYRAFHSLAGELMNSSTRYTAESKAIVWIIRKCALFPEGNSS